MQHNFQLLDFKMPQSENVIAIRLPMYLEQLGESSITLEMSFFPQKLELAMKGHTAPEEVTLCSTTDIACKFDNSASS